MSSALEVKDSSFGTEVLNSDTPVLVDFWADWCMPCRMLAPTIDAIADDFAGRVKVVKVNVDQNREAPAAYGIRGIPTLLFFKNGELKDRVVGAQAKALIAEKLAALLEA